MTTNHNRMIEIQAGRSPPRDDPVEIAYYGSSAFRITSPNGVSVMIDPWRNHPSHRWDWYFHDFPLTATDIGASTHAHFDHDALHRLDAHVLLDRLIGRYTFSDMTLHGLADKHETDLSCALHHEADRSHSMTKRFDREGTGRKIHMQSLGAMRHFDFNDPSAYSYD